MGVERANAVRMCEDDRIRHHQPVSLEWSQADSELKCSLARRTPPTSGSFSSRSPGVTTMSGGGVGPTVGPAVI